MNCVAVWLQRDTEPRMATDQRQLALVRGRDTKPGAKIQQPGKEEELEGGTNAKMTSTMVGRLLPRSSPTPLSRNLCSGLGPSLGGEIFCDGVPRFVGRSVAAARAKKSCRRERRPVSPGNRRAASPTLSRAFSATRKDLRPLAAGWRWLLPPPTEISRKINLGRKISP